MIARTAILTGGLLLGALHGAPSCPEPTAKPPCRGDYEVLSQAFYEDEGIPCDLQPGQQLALRMNDSFDDDDNFNYCADMGGHMLSLDDPAQGFPALWYCITGDF